MLFECFNGAAMVTYQAALGLPLPQVVASAREQLARNGGRVMHASFHLLHELRVARALAGPSAGPHPPEEDGFDGERGLAPPCSTELGNQVGYYLASQVRLHAHLGDWRGALEWARRADDTRPNIRGKIAEIDLVQFEALAVVGLALDGGADAAAAAERALSGVRAMRDWAACERGNFEHKALLLEGALAGLRGHPPAARRCFEQGLAVLGAGAAWVQDAGLIHEWSARVHRHAGDDAAARAAARAAIEAYGAWGAGAKQALMRLGFGLTD